MKGKIRKQLTGIDRFGQGGNAAMILRVWMHKTKKIFVPLTEIQRNQEGKEELTYWDAKIHMDGGDKNKND